nr:uncharacterized protein LOC129255445 [Lytechinus pictus]
MTIFQGYVSDSRILSSKKAMIRDLCMESCGDCRLCKTYVRACDACYFGIATRKRNSLIEAADNDGTNELQRAALQTSITAKRPTCYLDQIFSKLPPEIQRQIEELILSSI